MLPGDDQLQRLIKVVGPLTFELKMPSSPEEYFSVSGAVPTMWQDQRRFVRKHLRVVAAIQYRRSLPAHPRSAQWHKVVTRDLSRNGVSFLHSEQIFPLEQLLLVLPDCKPRCIEVVRCRRLGDQCFQVGASFIQRFRPQTDE